MIDCACSSTDTVACDLHGDNAVVVGDHVILDLVFGCKWREIFVQYCGHGEGFCGCCGPSSVDD